jgi:DNA-binding MarR family transcriptional regulator
LVQRERLEHDQRRVLVSVTEKGESLAAALAPQIEVTYQALEAQIGPRFTQDLYAMLDELQRKLR